MSRETLAVRKVHEIETKHKIFYECNQCLDVYSEREGFLNKGNHYFCSAGCVKKWEEEHNYENEVY